MAALVMTHHLASLGHEEVGWVNILGAYCGAEAAETAVKGKVAVRLFEEEFGKTARAAIFAQETTLLDADGTVNAVFCHCLGFVGKMIGHDLKKLSDYLYDGD